MNEQTINDTLSNTKGELKSAFDDMIDMFQQARDAIDSPELFPVPATDRNLAEGYRYVLGFMLNGIERSLGDPLYPRFRRAIQPMNRSTIDNADAVYLATEIDGNHSYWLRGKALDTRHWRGQDTAPGKTAPQYVIFELSSGYAGDSGSLAEMRPGSRINTSILDSHNIVVDPEGHFEILIAPEKPAEYQGNFMLSKRESRGTEFVGRFLSCRELFHDWENQDLLDLEILRIGAEKEPRPALDSKAAIAMMNQVGKVAKNHVHFWNAFNTITLETYGKVEGGINSGDPNAAPFMPTNDMNAPNALGVATGGGQSTNIYAGGVYLLDDNEALIIESTVPVTPSFMGFHLSNLWGESLDFESYQSNLNAHQMESEDGHHFRWVVSHKDPGIHNWVDTTGLPHGYLTIRWTYPEQPPKEQWPTLQVTKVTMAEVDSHFPGASRVSSQQRQANILMRHKHVQRRYREY